MTDQLWIAHNVRSVFPDSHILISIREQGALIRSFFNHGLRVRGAALGFTDDSFAKRFAKLLTFEEWLTLAHDRRPYGFLSLLEFDELYKCWDTVFPGRVHVLPLEAQAKDPGVTSQILCDCTGVDVEAVSDFLSGPPQNVYANKAKEVRRPSIAKRAAYRIAKEVLLRNIVTEKRVDLELVKSSFAAANRNLAELTGMDLESHGYTVTEK